MVLFNIGKKKEEKITPIPQPILPPIMAPAPAHEPATMENLKTKIDLALSRLDNLKTQQDMLNDRLVNMEKMLKELYAMAKS